ncbi:MAG: MFS transporter [Myxococcales bacterium]|jgi:fucose permease|nr:MFS transporter [Myxococcales bacterium]
MSHPQGENTTPSFRVPGLLVLLSFAAFVSLGMPDGLLGTAWPSLHRDFAQPVDAMWLLLAGETLGYLIASTSAGWLMHRMAVGRILAWSCALTSLSLFGITLSPAWPPMFAMALVLGIGAGAIDTALNVWVEAHLPPHMMHWLHGSFGIGITLGPALMTASLLLTQGWRTGYLVVGALQLALGLVFFRTSAAWNIAPRPASNAAIPATTATATAPVPAPEHAPYADTLRHPRAWLSALIFFVYVGIEISTGHWAFTWLIRAHGYDVGTAGFWNTAYWGLFAAGRFGAGWINRHIAAPRLLPIAIVASLVLAILLALVPIPVTKGPLLALLGLAMSPIFAALISTTAIRIPRAHIRTTIGLQMSAAGIGAGLLPSITGLLVAAQGPHVVPLVAAGSALSLLILVTWLHRPSKSS